MKPTHSPERRRLLQSLSAGVPAAIAMPLVYGRSAVDRDSRAANFVLYHRPASGGLYRRWDGVAASAATGLVEVQMHAVEGVNLSLPCEWSVDAMVATPDAPPVAFTAWRYSSERPDAGSRSARFVAGARQWRGVRLRFREMDGGTGHTQYLPLVQEGSANLAEGAYLLLRLPADQQHETLDPSSMQDWGVSAALAFEVRAWEAPLDELPRADLAAIRAAQEPVESLA